MPFFPVFFPRRCRFSGDGRDARKGIQDARMDNCGRVDGEALQGFSHEQVPGGRGCGWSCHFINWLVLQERPCSCMASAKAVAILVACSFGNLVQQVRGGGGGGGGRGDIPLYSEQNQPFFGDRLIATFLAEVAKASKCIFCASYFPSLPVSIPQVGWGIEGLHLHCLPWQ